MTSVLLALLEAVSIYSISVCGLEKTKEIDTTFTLLFKLLR
jgi:hypothetical protein